MPNRLLTHSVIDDNPSSIFLAADSNYLYWKDSRDGALRRGFVNSDGKLQTGSIIDPDGDEYYITADDTWLYWLDSRDGALRRGFVNSDGKLQTGSIIDPDGDEYYITADDTWLYWLDSRDGALRRGRVNESTGILETKDVIDPLGEQFFLASDNEWIYWKDSRDGSLRRGKVNEDKSPPTLETSHVIDKDGSQAFLAADKNYLYWLDTRDGLLRRGRVVDTGNDGIYRFELHTSEVIDEVPSEKYLAANNDWLFWLDTRDNRLRRGTVREVADRELLEKCRQWLLEVAYRKKVQGPTLILRCGNMDDKRAEAIWTAPTGWYIENHEVGERSRFGHSSYSVETFAAGGEWVEESTVESNFNEKIDQASGDDKQTWQNLKEAYLHLLRQVKSSHNVIKISGEARGAGLFGSGGSIDVSISVQIVHVGTEEALLEILKNIAEKM